MLVRIVGGSLASWVKWRRRRKNKYVEARTPTVKLRMGNIAS